jgi:signal transduction histidine kinase
MGYVRKVDEPGESPAVLSRRAARQGAYLFGLAGILGLAAIAPVPDRTPVLLAIAAADFTTAGLCRLLPWERWPVTRVAWLTLEAFTVLAVSTWVFAGYTGGTIPFYMLVFAWLGLHQPPRVIVWAAAPATVSYAGGLLASGAPPDVVGGTAVLVPVLVAIGLTISRNVHGLRESQRQLRQQEHWRAAMIATLAHDVRSPLSSITGTLEIVSDDPDTPGRLRPLLDAATRQAERITRLASTLLDVERIGQDRLRLDIAEIDLRELASKVAGLTNPDQVRVEVPDELRLRADPARIEQILINLTNNALRHGKGPVVLGAARHDGHVTLTVRDHGPGVRPDAAAQLFTRLAEGRPGTDSVGLGLWIVRMLAEAHGGSVAQRNEQPGAVFSVDLPQRQV